MPRSRTGHLYWTKSGWRARVPVGGKKCIVNLETQNRLVAEQKLRRMIEDSAPGVVVQKQKQIREAWAAGDVWALDLTPIEPPRSPGVYAMFVIPGFVKIGRSDNIAKRVAAFQTAYPIRVSLVAVLSRDPNDEDLFHAQLSENRVRGEWFILSHAVRQVLYRARQILGGVELTVPQFPGAEL